MSEMIERVARALCDYASGPNVVDPAPTWDAISEIERNEWRGEARAAIEAMREPTEAMIDAGRDIGPDAPYGAAETAERWRTMIDAALKD